MARQTRITIRQDGLLIVRGRTSRRVWCPGCGAESEMITIDRPAVIVGTPSAFDSLDLHRVQAADGSPLICLKSLLGCVAKKKLN